MAVPRTASPMQSLRNHCAFRNARASKHASAGHIGMVLVYLLVLTFLPVPGRTAEPIAKGLNAPIFVAPHPHPVAILSIGTISKEYARHGFFRIGLLPELLIDSVTLEIRNSSEVSRILGTVQARSQPLLPQKGVRIQDVCIKVDYEGQRILVASQIRDLGKPRWQFADGVVSTDGTNFVTFDHASLSVGGTDFGQLVAVSGHDRTTIHFLPRP